MLKNKEKTDPCPDRHNFSPALQTYTILLRTHIIVNLCLGAIKKSLLPKMLMFSDPYFITYKSLKKTNEK